MMDSKIKLGLALAIGIAAPAMAADHIGGANPSGNNDAMVSQRHRETVGTAQSSGVIVPPSQRSTEPGVGDPDKITQDEKSGRVNDDNGR